MQQISTQQQIISRIKNTNLLPVFSRRKKRIRITFVSEGIRTDSLTEPGQINS